MICGSILGTHGSQSIVFHESVDIMTFVDSCLAANHAHVAIIVGMCACAQNIMKNQHDAKETRCNGDAKPSRLRV